MSITFLCVLILQVAVVTAITLASTNWFARRGKAILGVVVSLGVIALVEIFLQYTVTASIKDCLRSACLSAGQPPDCVIGQFGCTEWSGLSRFVYFVAGSVDLVAYLIGCIVIYLKRRRKKEDLDVSNAIE